MTRGTLCVFALGVVVALAGQAVAQDEREALAAKGIKVVSNGITLEAEAELAKMLKDSARLGKNVRDAQSKLMAVEKTSEERKKMIALMTQERITLQAQYNQTNNVAQQNRIVVRLNELADRINLMVDDETLPKQLQETRSAANQAREEYIQHVLDMQKLAEKIRQQYVSLAEDSEVTALLQKYNEANKKDFKVAESRTFQSNLKQLKRLEDSVLTDSIQLTRDGSDTFTVSAVLNGKYTKDLVLDSGASIMCLPYALAKEIGCEPGADAPRVTLTLADGSEVQGQMITLDQVRVGRFEVESIECAVMPPNLPNAAAILGMSFLRNFSFKIDSDTGLLTMSKVEGAR